MATVDHKNARPTATLSRNQRLDSASSMPRLTELQPPLSNAALAWLAWLEHVCDRFMDDATETHWERVAEGFIAEATTIGLRLI